MIRRNENITDFDQVHINRLVCYITNVLIPANPKGFTLDPLTFQSPPVFDTQIYPNIHLVSIKGYDCIFTSIPSFDEVHNWVAKNYKWLCIGGNYIGFWEHLNLFHLDITNAILGCERALSHGKSDTQIAIYHLASGKVIPIDYTDDDDCGN